MVNIARRLLVSFRRLFTYLAPEKLVAVASRVERLAESKRALLRFRFRSIN
jgi:hypothetical protein